MHGHIRFTNLIVEIRKRIMILFCLVPHGNKTHFLLCTTHNRISEYFLDLGYLFVMQPDLLLLDCVCKYTTFKKQNYVIKEWMEMERMERRVNRKWCAICSILRFLTSCSTQTLILSYCLWYSIWYGIGMVLYGVVLEWF